MRTGGMIARLNRPLLWLAAALVVGLGVRLLGIDFGLPLRLYPDEQTQVLNAQHMLTGDLNPHFFRYSSLYIYQLFTLDGAAQIAASLFRVDLASSAFYLLARGLSAVYGTLTVWAVYLLGRDVLSGWTGVAAAWLVAVNPEHIRQSHYAIVDIAMTFWIVLALVFAVRALRQPRASFLPAGVALGLAVGTKYSALLFVAVVGVFLLMSLYRFKRQGWFAEKRNAPAWILVAIGSLLGAGAALFPVDLALQIARQWSTDGTLKPEYLSLFNTLLLFWRAAAIGAILLGVLALLNSRARGIATAIIHPETIKFAGGVAATFFITSPYVLLDLPVAARDILYEYRHMLLGAAAQLSSADPLQAALRPTGLFPQPLYYVEWWLGQNGWLLAGLALLGIVLLARRTPQASWLVLSGFLLLSLTITHAATKADRYALPLVPLFAVWVGTASAWLFSRLKGSAVIRAAMVAAVLAVPLATAWSVLEREFILPNTNVLAYEWIQSNVPAGAAIVREDSTPDIEDATAAYRVTRTQSAFEDHTLADWERAGVQYILVGNLRDSYYRPNVAYFPQIVQNYALLDAKGTLQASFSENSRSSGTPVWVYRLP